MYFLSDLKRFCETTAEAACAIFYVLGRLLYLAVITVKYSIAVAFTCAVAYFIYDIARINNIPILEAIGVLLLTVPTMICVLAVLAQFIPSAEEIRRAQEKIDENNKWAVAEAQRQKLSQNWK
ncbi:MAG: hypothetical protein IK051_06425 [Rhodocyclaceae bacterium]|nr:hypothetical protein [Rhodocyclaceae bacterium]MBR4877066.1 hypothetical protein [Rhodocyclaceae bacterium]